jgi:hypothetical protein
VCVRLCTLARTRASGAVIHSHGLECVLATLLFEGQPEFRITHQEMIKGIVGACVRVLLA